MVTRPFTRSQKKQKESESNKDNVTVEEADIETTQFAFLTLNQEPKSLEEAKNQDEWPLWKEAMDEEIRALEKNETWSLVTKPKGARLIKTKWVYKIKLNPNGTVERYKARLVAKGYSQIPDVDYKETYAPVAGMTTIRTFLAIANQNSMLITQFDIKTAFLHGDVEEDLYMTQPEGYEIDKSKVCKLTKSIYGLKQAPRMWNKKFDAFLKQFNLEQGHIDKCIYYNQSRTLLLTIYVDDGLAAGTNKEELDSLLRHLQANFDLMVLNGDSFLGFRIVKTNSTLGIVQGHYIDKLLERFKMTECKVVETPEQVGWSSTESPSLPNDNKFKELVGGLLYIATCTRPDICHALSVASRTSQPTEAHWSALKRII